MQSGSDNGGSHHSNDRDRQQLGNNKLFVTNLDGSANQQQLKSELEEKFKQYVVKKSRNGQYCFAFVEYKSGEDGAEAIKNLDQTVIGGKKVKVEHQDNAKRRKDSNKGCYICGKMGHFARQCKNKSESGNYRRRSYSRSNDSRQKRKHKKRRERRSDSSDRSYSNRKKEKKNRSKSREDKKKKKSKKKYRSSSDE